MCDVETWKFAIWEERRLELEEATATVSDTGPMSGAVPVGGS